MYRDIYDVWCTTEREEERIGMGERDRYGGTAIYRCGCESTWAHYRFTEPSRAESEYCVYSYAWLCGANNLVLLHLLHVCAGETLLQLPSPAASASLSQRSSRRISISARANVNAAYCVVVSLKSHDAQDAVMIIIRYLAFYITVLFHLLLYILVLVTHYFKLFNSKCIL